MGDIEDLNLDARPIGWTADAERSLTSKRLTQLEERSYKTTKRIDRLEDDLNARINDFQAYITFRCNETHKSIRTVFMFSFFYGVLAAIFFWLWRTC